MHTREMIKTILAIFISSVLFLSGCSSPNDANDSQKTAYINLDETHQVIRSFGAANILPWRPDMTTDEINKAFGTGDGQIGFSILRLRVPLDTNEFSLNVPTAQSANSMGVTIIASPWSPPAWMKTNNNIVGGRLNDTSYAAYAAYLKSFVDYMANNGVPIYAVSVQNEPTVTVTYESCYWNTSEMLRFIKENAPSIGTKVIAPEHYRFSRSFSDPLLNDPVALANLDILGGHIYGGGLQNYPLAESKGKEIWMTEYLINSGNPPTDLTIDTGWTGAMLTAKSISDCKHANMNTYIWWYIVRYYGPIADGTYANKGDLTKKGYVMSQFARFVRPGYLRISATENPQQNIFITAFKDNSKIVIVAVNNGTKPIEQKFELQNGTITSLTPYNTSENKNCLQGNNIAVGNGSFTATL